MEGKRITAEELQAELQPDVKAEGSAGGFFPLARLGRR